MRAQELTINGNDAFTEYGIFMTNSGFNALLAPRTLKEPISSTSRLEHGKRVILPTPENNVESFYESREFSMEINMSCKTPEIFNQKLAQLEADLTAGWLTLTTCYRPGIVFHCRYISTSNFTCYQRRAAKMTLKLEEPNPGNRT